MSGCGAAFSALLVLTPPATISEKLQIKPRAGAETLMLSQNRTSPLPNHSSARSRSLYVGSNPPRPKILSAEIELSRTNALIVNFTITVNQPSYVYIEYHSPTDGRFRSSTRMIQHTDTIPIVRLRADTAYTYRVVAVDSRSRRAFRRGTFRTGSLPAGLQNTSFRLMTGQFTAPLLLVEHNDNEFSGIVALDSKANIVWYYEVPKPERGPFGVLTLAQKPNNNIVYLSLFFGIHEISPEGTLVASINSPCMPPDLAPWHHDVLTRPHEKVWFLGNELHEAGVVLGPQHGPQVTDTIEEWDQVTGRVQRLFDLYDIQSFANRSASSDALAFESPTVWSGCPRLPNAEDYSHSNSLFVGANGNVLMSNRHLNQVISIAPNFQSLEWRLGGLESSFHFSKSEDRFYHQHSVKELSNGDILLFDNGNSRPQSEGGSYSRALQLRLDFGNMTAVKVWEYRHVPDLYADCCSSVDRLPNGNTIIDFGFNSIVTGACCRVLTIVEANSAGQTVAEMKISGPGKQIQYRVHPINSLLGEARIRF